MRNLFLHVSVLSILWAYVSGCSWSLIDFDGDSCPRPSISFAGAEHPILCAGDETTLRIDVSHEDASFTYLIAAENGRVTPVSQSDHLWTYVNPNTEGETKFHAFVENSCGITSASFVVHNIYCTPSDSDTDSDSSGPSVDYDGPRYVILFIGDGMGQNSETALSRYIHGADYQLRFHSFPYGNQVTTWDINTYNLYSYNIDGALYDPESVDPYRGYDPNIGGTEISRGVASVDDYFLTPQLNWPDAESSASAVIPATDSAASATAMATGKKTDSHNLSWVSGDLPNGELKTIAEYAREEGHMGIGVVSTVPLSHATPAAFITHNESRYALTAIADDIIRHNRADVVITGGHPIFYDNFKYISEEDWAFLQTTDQWHFVQRQAGVNGGETILAGAEAAVASGKPLMGIFGKESFEHPEPQDNPGAPSFVFPTNENPTLAEATSAALTVLSSHENGFFLMVEGGAIDLANHQRNYARMVGCMWDFERAVAEAVNWVNQEGDDITMDNTLILVTADHNNGYISFNPDNPLGAGDLPLQISDSGWTYPDGDVAYALGGHTNEMVHIYGIGAGIFGSVQNLFTPYEGVQYEGLPIIDNTHIFYLMMDFLGLEQK